MGGELVMKKNILHLLFLVAVLAFSSCKDFQTHTLGPISSGTANFSKYVAVGNSLTAGYENGALYQEAQKYSFPNLLARQLRIQNFEQPLVSSPGIGQRLEISNFDTFSITKDTKVGTPLNADLPRAYDNLGIPGAVLGDYSNINNQAQLKQRATDPTNPAYNPFYALVMRTETQKAAPNINDLVKSLNPTLVTFWLGANDALGFVTSGGVGQQMTDPGVFQQLYQYAGAQLDSLNATVVLMNLPDITTIPFVFLTDAQLVQEGKIKLDAQGQYQLVTPQGDLNIYIQTAHGARVMMSHDFLLLTAQEYLANANPANGDMITPQGAIPSQYVLDGPTPTSQQGSSELEKVIARVSQYNQTMSAVAQADNFAMVDINSFFKNIFNNYMTKGAGYIEANGDTLNPIPGSMFGLDGIHPTNKGYALVTNEIIKILNQKYGSNIPLVDVRTIPLGLPWAK